MVLNKQIEVMQIVAKYVNGNEKYCEAQHDILFLPLGNHVTISEEDEKRLLELGAHRSDSDCWAIHT